MVKERCYITRDEGDNFIWVWRQPSRGNWAPINVGGTDFVSYQRDGRSLENTTCYLAKDFKKKFGTTIRHKTKKSIYLDKELLNSEDYKEFSSDPNRKQ